MGVKSFMDKSYTSNFVDNSSGNYGGAGMIIKCTEEEKEKIMLHCCVSDMIIHETINCISSNCEKCFEEHNIKFEIVEDK